MINTKHSEVTKTGLFLFPQAKLCFFFFKQRINYIINGGVESVYEGKREKDRD